MKLSIFTSGLAVAGMAAAAPLVKRATPDIDLQVLNFALTLEHLESAFYKEGLAMFQGPAFKSAGYTDEFYSNIKETAADEATHVTFLTTAIKAAGGIPVMPCKYSFGITDVKTFVTTAALLEGVGVTAYLGAAALITSPTYLTAAGSILTVEARHSAVIRDQLKMSPFASPFDAPQGINEVYSLASALITSCPDGNSKAQLPALKAFPALAVVATGAAKPGQWVMVKSAKKLTGTVYYNWANVLGAIGGTAKTTDGINFQVHVPLTGVNGQSYVVLSSVKGTIADASVLAGPAIVEVTAAYEGRA